MVLVKDFRKSCDNVCEALRAADNLHCSVSLEKLMKECHP